MGFFLTFISVDGKIWHKGMKSEKKIKAQSLQRFVSALFKRVGMTNTIAQDVTDALIQTSLRGVDSHGVRLVPHYVRAIKLGRINPRPSISFKKTAGATGVVNTDNGHGIYAGLFAMRKAILLAKKQGIGAVTVTKSTHFGAAGIYALEAADNDMIGLSFTHSDALVVPYGGINPVLGTNPIAFAAPCAGEEPVCLDMATSQISWNKLLMHRAYHEVLPHGVAVNVKGMETQDPMTANALLPLGGYKGYGLALMVDIFSGLLAGMPFGLGVSHMFLVDKKKRNLGHFMVAINIAAFQPVSTFKRRLKQEIEKIRREKPVLGINGVLVAGDPEKLMYTKRLKEGIPLTEEQCKEFEAIAKEFAVSTDIFSHE